MRYTMYQCFLQLDGLAFVPGLWTSQKTFCSVIACTSLDNPKCIFVFPVTYTPCGFFSRKNNTAIQSENRYKV